MTGKQRRYLRGLGHHLDPVVSIGKEGITDGLIGAVGATLESHELIKLKLSEAAGDDRQGLAEAIAQASSAELVQVLGRTILLYRRREKEPTIVLP